MDHCLDCDLKSCHHLYCHDSTLVSTLQRRVRNLKEQISRKDLHLDLLRRKLALQEDNAKAKCIAQNERDEVICRNKDLSKQIDRLRCELSDTKAQVCSLSAQLADASDYKLTSLERARKIEDLQKRLIESESLRIRYNCKVSELKDQVRTTGDTIEQERHVSGHSMHLLRDELSRTKSNLLEVSKRESELNSFRCSIARILGVILPTSDFDLTSRLQKLVDAHHDLLVVSKKYDDPCWRITGRCPTPGSIHALHSPHSLHCDDVCDIYKPKYCPYV